MTPRDLVDHVPTRSDADWALTAVKQRAKRMQCAIIFSVSVYGMEFCGRKSVRDADHRCQDG